jgi:uncharacterized membrane protein
MRVHTDSIPKDLILLVSLAVVLTLGRVWIFHTTHYIYLLWNIFLAIIPFFISTLLYWYTKKSKPIYLFVYIGLFLWLVTFPNAPYIVTDLIHLGHGYMANMLYDTMLLFTVAWVGLLLGFHSLATLEKILLIQYSQKKVIIIRLCVILLTSFGIYLGRFVRFNSWDIVTHPSSLFMHIWNVASDPSIYLFAYIFTLVSFIFIYITYTAWQYQIKSYV